MNYMITIPFEEFNANNVVFKESSVGTGSSSTSELIAVFVIDTTLPEVSPWPVASPHMATHPPSSFCIKSKKSPPTSVAVCWKPTNSYSAVEGCSYGNKAC